METPVIFRGYRSAQPSLFRSGLVRTDSLGDSLWSKELGFIPIDIVPVNLPGDSGYVMIANYYQPTQSFDNLNPFCEVQNSDIRLVRTDLDGNIIWEKKFGGSILDIASNLIVTNDMDIVSLVLPEANQENQK
ncbi:MAG: hypothetical protein IPN88_03185 [Bacteroidetes bacterium]|nr:hypothetical protein [Bacteroidota bacterium]